MTALFVLPLAPREERQKLHALKNKTDKKREPVIELWLAINSSPSGQEESPHGV
jgi:hypothetical protein